MAFNKVTFLISTLPSYSEIGQGILVSVALVKSKSSMGSGGQSLVEAYGAQRIMTDYVNDLKNAITHEKLISKRGNPDIIGILKLAGDPTLQMENSIILPISSVRS